MALFDVFIQNKKVKVVKVKKEGEAVLAGFTYVKTITNSTKLSAQKQAEIQFKSGLIKLPSVKKVSTLEKVEEMPTAEHFEEKKAIYCDFNGVVDDFEKHMKSNQNESDAFRVPKMACPHKIYKLTKLALDTNSDIVITSLWRKFGIYFDLIIYRCLMNCEIPEYVEFYKENEDKIEDLTTVCPTEELDARTDEIRKHIKDFKYTTFVVFEDDHFIDEDLNPIMTNMMEGLTDLHIEKAYKILR